MQETCKNLTIKDYTLHVLYPQHEWRVKNEGDHYLLNIYQYSDSQI